MYTHREFGEDIGTVMASVIAIAVLYVTLVPADPEPTLADPPTPTAEATAGAPAVGSPAPQKAITWRSDREARQLQTKTGLPTVRFVTLRAGCAPCVTLDRVVLTDPRVIELLADNAICVRDYTPVLFPQRGRPWMRVTHDGEKPRDYYVSELEPEAFARSMAKLLGASRD